MELAFTTNSGVRIELDVREGWFVHLNTPDTYAEWGTLTCEEQAKWLEAQSIITAAIKKAVALIQPSVVVQAA